MIDFAEISWAWVLAPFSVLSVVAYVGRWLKHQKLEAEFDAFKRQVALERLAAFRQRRESE
ncbi:MAG: hypothetical protein ACTSXZ_10195 [Alphaproteobacteria bacterium]